MFAISIFGCDDANAREHAENHASQQSIMEARAQSAPLHLSTSNPTAQELGNATQQKLRVCDICGALLSIFDSNDRLAEQ